MNHRNYLYFINETMHINLNPAVITYVNNVRYDKFKFLLQYLIFYVETDITLEYLYSNYVIKCEDFFIESLDKEDFKNQLINLGFTLTTSFINDDIVKIVNFNNFNWEKVENLYKLNYKYVRD